MTRQEAAVLTGLSVKKFDKAIEQGTIGAKRRRKRRTTLDPASVIAVYVVDRAGVPLPVKVKKQINQVVRQNPRMRAGSELRIGPSLVVRWDQAIDAVTERVERYATEKDSVIESNPAILGGDPVIRGTRIPARIISERLANGETMDVLLEDFDVTPKQLEIAAEYGRAHPRRGRPRKPWLDASS